MPTEVTVGIDIGTTSVKAVAVDADGEVRASARVAGALKSRARRGARSRRRAGVAVGGPRGARRRWRRRTSTCAPSTSRRWCRRCARSTPTDARSPTGSSTATPGASGGDSAADPSQSGELARFLAWLVEAHPDAAGYWPAQAVANHALAGVGAIDTVVAMTTLPLFDFTGWDAGVAEGRGPRRHRATSGAGVGQRTDRHDPRRRAGRRRGGRAGHHRRVRRAARVGGGRRRRRARHPRRHRHRLGGHTGVGRGRRRLDRAPHHAGQDARSAGRRTPAGCSWTGSGGCSATSTPISSIRTAGSTSTRSRSGSRTCAASGCRSTIPTAGRRCTTSTSGWARRPSGGPPRGLGVRGAPHPRPRRRRMHAASSPPAAACRARSWMQALADGTGLPVDVVAVPQGAALGTAYLARVAAGLEADASDAGRWARTSHRVEPDDRRRRRRGPPLRALPRAVASRATR